MIAHADERTENLVFCRDGSEFVQNAEFAAATGQIERFAEPNVGGHCGIHQQVEAGVAQLFEHLPGIVSGGADMAANKAVRVLQPFHRCGSVWMGFSYRVFGGRFPREHEGKVSGVGGNASGI